MDQEKQEEKEKIINKEIEKEMKESYIDYAMSVIVGRALPDVRDGLKPVHRRILYAMYKMGMFHNKPFKKSARIVGEVLGKYHPHGDIAVYDTLVRMVQDFSLRYPLIDGQGNFGSIDGDSQAAMRYTEARLSKIAEEMLVDIDKNTVDFQPNFDSTLKEPVVLPSKIPNLLINGSSGIAVGMTTNIPPHNIAETIDAINAYLDNNNITINELIRYIKGPDFPTGAIIQGKNGIYNAYKTGKGRIVVKSKINIEETKNKRRLIVTEIPYMVNKSQLITEIAKSVRDGIIKGITDLRDESDREGIRIVIELSSASNPDIIINQLFKHTRLRTTFNINFIALVDNKPEILNLKQLISHYINHRKNVIKRRTLFDLENAKQRKHIVDGLIIAIKDIDNVIELIRKSKAIEEAKNKLIEKYNLSDIQAKSILEMRLQKLASLEQKKLFDENNKLIKEIGELEKILSSEKEIIDIIKNELAEIKEKYKDERRTEIIEGEEEIKDVESLIEDKDVVVIMTKGDYIKRTPLEIYKTQHRGGKGVIATTLKEQDYIEKVFVTTTHSNVLFFTNKGRVYNLKVYEIPEATRYSKGRPINNILNLKNEEISSVIPIKNFEKGYLFMVTEKGIVKKSKIGYFSNVRRTGIIAINLKDDKLINVLLTDGTKDILIATKKGRAIRFNEKDVRDMGRNAYGVRGIKLREDSVVSALVINSKYILTATSKGYGKRTKAEEYSRISRGGIGVINIKLSDKNGHVVSVISVNNGDEILVVTKKGQITRIPVNDISVIGRNTQGVRIIKLGEDDELSYIYKI